MIMVAGEQAVASLNQLEAPRGHSFGVGEQQLDNYARPEDRQDSGGVALGERGSQPPPHQPGPRGLGSAVSSTAWFGQSPGRRRAFLPPDCLSPTLFLYLQVATSVLSCLCLYDCNTFSWYFFIGLYSSGGTHSWAPARGEQGGQAPTLEKIRVGMAHPGNFSRGLNTSWQ